MEYAIHITNFKNLKYFQSGDYQRIYWGVEFCQNLIPSLVDTEKILKFVRENNLKFTLVTPFVAEPGLRRLKELFLWLKKRKVVCEILINDWGILELLHSDFEGYFNLALGRLLVRQQRDPVMKKVLKKQLPSAVRGKAGKIRIVLHKPPGKQYQEGIKASYINSSLLQDFLSGLGIKRVELNNLIQGLYLRGIRFKRSMYTPYIHISTTRFCPMESKFQKTHRIDVCGKECRKYYDVLRGRAVSKVIYRRGNTTFYKNPLDAKKVMEADIDRIVFQPEIPF